MDMKAIMTETRATSILVISSHVVRGGVGNRAAVFALETLGHPVWALPTVILPWHPGHGRSTRIATDDAAFAGACADLAGSSRTGELAGVLTGYFASAAQVEAAAGLVARLKTVRPDLPVLCDPVIGDHGGLYVPEAVATAIRDRLMPLATIATPNRFELAWLTGTEPASNLDLAAAARRLGPATVVVTSAFPMMEASTGNLMVSEAGLVLAEHRLLDNVPNGLGDLFSALFLARLVEGRKPEKALQTATASVFEITARTVREGGDELALARESASLATPMAMVQLRSILAPGGPRRVQPTGL